MCKFPRCDSIKKPDRDLCADSQDVNLLKN